MYVPAENKISSCFVNELWKKSKYKVSTEISIKRKKNKINGEVEKDKIAEDKKGRNFVPLWSSVDFMFQAGRHAPAC